ncbi:hypothetical protein [Demequina lignilytica]|uniref:DUF304 domain-containing protein n=1 Tax=Demequina lignilytica TaxID=3051663 RepID=A0AAW7M4B4_9MICO|nr:MULTISPECIES: hypothetical protein [unclassified Demequina]MDN4478806.1 hypothetical protein [Demequina sp. SYSU T00039-1]MDN4484095.1 hypothetical protein [Demequina sp. SYSU T0a273]MDN4488904.1 hypothetical protein [Demequina sp. SYSU T00039]MDN4490322.1 hypothetical protein [Demequina sp. SYSU T00068]
MRTLVEERGRVSVVRRGNLRWHVAGQVMVGAYLLLLVRSVLLVKGGAMILTVLPLVAGGAMALLVPGIVVILMVGRDGRTRVAEIVRETPLSDGVLLTVKDVSGKVREYLVTRELADRCRAAMRRGSARRNPR